MEENLEQNLKDEMPQLSCLLEKHKQLQERSVFKPLYQRQVMPSKVNNYYDSDSKNCTFEENLPIARTSKVYVNPNYTRKPPVIHINPHVQMKPSIYVNPKLIHKITNSQNSEQIQKNIPDDSKMSQVNIQSKCSVHVNPKLMTKLISKVPEKHNTKEENKDFLNSLCNQNISDNSYSVSIPQDKLNSASKTEFANYCLPSQSDCSLTSNKKKVVLSSTANSLKKSGTNYIIQSKTKLVKNSVIYKRSPNSTLVALSQRKLVRMKRNPKLISISSNLLKSLTPLKKRYSCVLKKTRNSPKYTALYSASPMSKTSNLKAANSNKTNWYNKSNSIVSKTSQKKINLTKVSNTSVALVSIGGIMYKTSRNQLVRSNPSTSVLKRRRSLISNKNSQYFVTKNGKKLLKLDSTKKRINFSVKHTSNTSVRNFKTDASNKVKRRSLQILRNKMQKNNQPCLLFQKFGYCNNQLTGLCSKLHDTKQVSLCKNFLQGKCVLDNCPLSHNVGPEKMPTCKYFLEGCCTRDGCPYLHVKLSSKNPICIEFLRGYCSQGNECQKRHINICPEFDKSGRCSKGKFCPYPHKSHLTETKRFKGSARGKINATTAKQLQKESAVSKTIEYNKRYYDETSEDLSQKRNILLNQVKIVKDMHAAQSNNIITDIGDRDKLSENHNTNENLELEKNLETVCNRPRRHPIGLLPAYIPID